MSVLRNVKNVVHNYSEAEVKVREATSNDPYPPNTQLLSHLAKLTNNQVIFAEIMQMIWKRLGDHGKNWRHVDKSLQVLDYLVKNGSERVIVQCKDRLFTIETLKNFSHIDTKTGRDEGENIRRKSMDLVKLLKDDETLTEERNKAELTRKRMGDCAAISNTTLPSQYQIKGDSGYNSNRIQSKSCNKKRNIVRGSDEIEAARPSNITEEELQVKLAMQISQAEIDQSKSQQEMEDIKIKKAIEQSKLDERNRQIKQKEQESKKQDNNLLNLGLDPWSTPSQTQPKPKLNNYDPFSMNDPIPEPQKTNPTIDPWSTTTVPTSNNVVTETVNDPWGDNFSKSVVPPINNGFGASNNDPFGNAFNSSSNPWEGAGTMQNSKSSEPILSTTIHNPQPILQTSQDLFNFEAMEPSNPNTASQNVDNSRQKSKTPDFSNFLGERSADLVNLDNIAGIPNNTFGNSQPKQNNIRSVSPSVFNNAPVASTNPFTSTISSNTGGVFSSNYSSNNPFATNTLGPTLNQIRAETNTANSDPFANMDPFANNSQSGFGQTVPNNSSNNESINPFF